MAIDNYSQISTTPAVGGKADWLHFQEECKSHGCTNIAVRAFALSYLHQERQKQQRGVSLTLQEVLFPQGSSLNQSPVVQRSKNLESVLGRVLESLQGEVDGSR
jgi:hypothetical protein